MGKIVLLAVAAAWAAVLIPPLLRSRIDNRPNSSVTDFRRQLSTLQRAVPTRAMVPIRAIGRPLVQGPATRPSGSAVRTPQVRTASMATRTHLQMVPAERRAVEQSQRQFHSRPMSQREILRRRRVNVLVVLAVATAMTMFLFATTKTDTMMYAFALAFCSLVGYCYKLIQIRNQELDRQYGDARWFNAA